MSEVYEVQVVGTVIGGHATPADDYQGGVESIIRLNPSYPVETVMGLEEFSHLEVTWRFHLASPADVALHARSPRNDPRWPPSGTFAHRNHRRPNQIAVSHPRLLKVDGLDLHVTDLDAVDGTPVLDLAPWFPAMGPRGSVHVPAWVNEMLPNYWTNASDR
ncbi:SAM-dependent methyltransferase [Streptomyces jumonjinensis]|uniref:SAM-dependent methyltransferase n=1 Tax=Streptomyces jumonjinensis TaxID=1945 RepID=A0A646KDP7_STRJU|nr:SAM-dependent methyltransferase [Streptomyces jumonjinensis]MQT00365.1 SAM-dependent methyltransferase [Streptomyces jumonjinensis]